MQQPPNYQQRRRLLESYADDGSDVYVDPSYEFRNQHLRDAYVALHAWKHAILSDPLNVTGSWSGPDVRGYYNVYCVSSDHDSYVTVVAGVDLNHADLAGQPSTTPTRAFCRARCARAGEEEGGEGRELTDDDGRVGGGC
ncbi:hypothetical protein QYE76_014896 [Lolium multiflorum]|uniref:Uncharacterized protein n=1 Tax=Lolium multiflorum TaxID=4521 RepID=A0AAD8U5K6_LOLMU|nr:hypothetical protein QYE76_014896 [Lolium multiflorum]